MQGSQQSEIRVDLQALRPTQITLGMVQVRQKMRVTTRHGAPPTNGAQGEPDGEDGLWTFLRRHPVKLVMGPHGRQYVVDHHHWARAWLELGHLEAPGTVVADLRHLDIGAFWEQMQALGHVHPYDEHGQRLDIQALPSTVLEMRDDPYRSLAAFARNAGAYRKPGNAYGDFQWAGLLRDNIDGRLDTIGGFALALARAVRLARSRKAKALPGYIGREAPIPDA